MVLRVLVDGLGLMGGSLAAALTAAGAEVFCHHRRPEVSQRAAQRGWGQALQDLRQAPPVDVAISAVPVSVLAERLRLLHQTCPGALISDVGSTKAGLCQQLSDLAASGVFIGSHPMCGSHAQGLENAHPDLYRGARVIITPHADCPQEAEERICQLWQLCQAQVLRMDPESHDRAVAEASHLPHIFAVQAARLLGPAGLPLAASGFRDTSRVAAGSPSLWADILIENRSAILAELGQAGKDLAALAAALEAADHAAVSSWLEEGRQARAAFDQRSEQE